MAGCGFPHGQGIRTHQQAVAQVVAEDGLDLAEQVGHQNGVRQGSRRNGFEILIDRFEDNAIVFDVVPTLRTDRTGEWVFSGAVHLIRLYLEGAADPLKLGIAQLLAHHFDKERVNVQAALLLLGGQQGRSCWAYPHHQGGLEAVEAIDHFRDGHVHRKDLHPVLHGRVGFLHIADA